ncbi:hypothetical protein GIB67_034863 [Kingdonia uniflora]|uniref:Uncharacterized protein n=1 Tax=Kingdonia uniflora TaxID=39325 RepID=A0A7J7ME45_9MAGN|nr:hypothetical protein GIB67_034863 [Kingdonia uniflora]
MQQSSYSKSIPGYLDEFRHGFPSGGLSTDMVRWWGDIGEDEMFEEEPTDDQVNEQQCHRDEGKSLEDEKQDTGSEKTEVGVQGVALLSSLRKRAANEGREGLQIGVCSRRKTFKIGEKEKLLLLKVLKTSLPSQLML